MNDTNKDKTNDATPDMNAFTAALIERLATEAAEPNVMSVAIDGTLGDGLPDKIPLAFNPKTGTFASVAHLIEEYRTAPARRTGIARVTTLDSFCDLVNRHKDSDSVLFGNTTWPAPSLTGVMDYHKVDGGARFAKHKVQYDFPVTEEFKAWIDKDGEAMTQGDFAAFLENHAAELAAADDMEAKLYGQLFNAKFATPNELVALARQLEIHVGSKFKQTEILQSGERVVEFTEEHTDAQGDTVDIPGLFMVAVPAFLDGAPVRMPARLRYRVSGGKVVWYYDLYRWETFLRERVQADLRQAADKTALPAYEGKPEGI